MARLEVLHVLVALALTLVLAEKLIPVIQVEHLPVLWSVNMLDDNLPVAGGLEHNLSLWLAEVKAELDDSGGTLEWLLLDLAHLEELLLPIKSGSIGKGSHNSVEGGLLA